MPGPTLASLRGVMDTREIHQLTERLEELSERVTDPDALSCGDFCTLERSILTRQSTRRRENGARPDRDGGKPERHADGLSARCSFWESR